MKIQIVNVSVGQTAKVLAALYVLISLPFLVIGALFGAFQGSVGVIVIAVVIAPLIYGVLTFLCTGLVAWLYNVVAGRVGGMEYSIKEIPDTISKS
ncbi:hypothetical protein [Massilia sp. 9I]|uniref:hypothetical protein n=1 Tax=Massilia sp. 9I TaxID=2653152 RepID=UPI0012F3761B|nr:hypothetical protein [Massilia sp. 9I]VXC72410.1 conserved hypothetical protein [Massilia sp. 9I]